MEARYNEVDVTKTFAGSAVDARIAAERKELTAAFELVYRSYRAKGYVRAHPSRMVYRPTFALPTSRTIVAVGASGKVVGTLTLVGDSREGLEIEAAFEAEAAQLRQRGRRLAEVTALAIEPCDDLPAGAAFWAITRLMFQYADSQGYDDLAMVVHPRHFPFYRRQFGAASLGSPRPYDAACNKPGLFCHIDVSQVKRSISPELRAWFTTCVFVPESHDFVSITRRDHEYFLKRTRHDAAAIHTNMPAARQRVA